MTNMKPLVFSRGSKSAHYLIWSILGIIYKKHMPGEFMFKADYYAYINFFYNIRDSLSDCVFFTKKNSYIDSQQLEAAFALLQGFALERHRTPYCYYVLKKIILESYDEVPQEFKAKNKETLEKIADLFSERFQIQSSMFGSKFY
jgi:hypothetical protein